MIKKIFEKNKLKNCVYLDSDIYIQYAGMIHLSEHVRYTTGNCQKLWTAYLFRRRMKSSQPEFYTNASLSSQVLFPKHYIFMYLGEYPANFGLSVK